MKNKILVSSLFLFQICCADEQDISNIEIPESESDIFRSTLPVHTGNAPLPGGSYYSQALYVNQVRELLFIAGQLPIDPVTNIVIMDPALATRRCMLNIQALLNNAGMDFSNVKKVIIAITNMDDVRTVCAVYASFLSAPYPTLSVIGVASMPLGSVVGIEAIATT